MIDTSLGYAAGGAIVVEDLAAQAEQKARRLLAGLRQRLSLPFSTLEFVENGAPAAEIVRLLKDVRPT